MLGCGLQWVCQILGSTQGQGLGGTENWSCGPGPGQLRRPDVCPAPSPLGISYKADAEAIRDSRKLYDCPPGLGTGHFDPASLIRTTPDGSNRALYAASLLAAQEKRQSFGSPRRKLRLSLWRLRLMELRLAGLSGRPLSRWMVRFRPLR